jgi:hypothetical protein
LDSRDDLQSKDNREDIAIMSPQNEEIKKNVTIFATIYKVRGRTELISEYFDQKLCGRPTMEIFHLDASSYDYKILDCVKIND